MRTLTFLLTSTLLSCVPDTLEVHPPELEVHPSEEDTMIQQLSGTALPRMSEPAAALGIPDGRGLYPWSAFFANLTYLNSGTVTPTQLDGANQGNLSFLLFTSDVPLRVQSFQYPIGSSVFFGSVELPPTPLIGFALSSLTSFPPLVTTSGGGVAAVSTPGAPLQGYIGTVPCAGFPVKDTLTTYSLTQTDGGAAILRVVYLDVIANGAVINGPPVINQSTDFAPVILRYSDYSQDILDNGNVIVNGSTTYTVVGLYYVP